MEAIGPIAGTCVMSLLYATIRVLETRASAWTFFLTFLTGIVFSIAWLRTHGMWLLGDAIWLDGEHGAALWTAGHGFFGLCRRCSDDGHRTNLADGR